MIVPVSHDVSSDFIPSRSDARIISEILPHEATPRAIRKFSKAHRELTDYGYWFLLGTLWVSYTGYSEIGMWRRLFSSPRARRDTSLMKPSELAVWRSLPENLTVFRAHRPNETDWLAYTLDPAKAVFFATKRGAPEITQYSVKKEHALCCFLRRGEREVLVLDKAHVLKENIFPIRIIETNTA